MTTFTITLEKQQSKRSNSETIKRQLLQIAERGVAGRRHAWSHSRIPGCVPVVVPGGVAYRASIRFTRRKKAAMHILDAEKEAVADFMASAGKAMNWQVVETTATWHPEKTGSVPREDATATESAPTKVDADDFVDFEKALTYADITIPDVFIHGTDEEIETHPAFANVYGRAPHVRTMAESMHTMCATRGARRNHLVLYGLPACGKSTLFHCWQAVLPVGSYIRINANSATKAGLEYLFLRRLRETGCPPFLFVEEMEKTIEAVLTTWLSILDERAEVRKIIHGKLRYAEVRALALGTVNDKLLFDRLMGGRPRYPGALSSRMIGIYVPRPDMQVMRRILARDIKLYYPEAKMDAPLWIEACIDLAEQLQINDPRIIVSWLDGRNRLLTRQKQDDILKLHDLEQKDQVMEEHLPDFGATKPISKLP